jgi:hypothetical protein
MRSLNEERDIEAVWEHYVMRWRSSRGKGPKPYFTSQRKAAIRARLREFDKATLMQAVDGAFSNEFLLSQGYTLPENIFKNAETVERRIATNGQSRRKWFVSVPIAGTFTVEVAADDEPAAIEAAWDKINDIDGPPEKVGHVEWEFYHKIVEGNVCHVRITEPQAEEAKQSVRTQNKEDPLGLGIDPRIFEEPGFAVEVVDGCSQTHVKPDGVDVVTSHQDFDGVVSNAHIDPPKPGLVLIGASTMVFADQPKTFTRFYLTWKRSEREGQ